MKPIVVSLAGLGVVCACFVGGRALDSPSPAAAHYLTGIDLAGPENPANAPFPGPPAGLSADQQRAVNAVSGLARAGALTSIAVVESDTYGRVMCGRMTFEARERDVPVWLVWFEGPFRTLATSGGGLSRESRGEPFPSEPSSKLYVVDARTFTSRQTFAPWPIAPSPKANCPQ